MGNSPEKTDNKRKTLKKKIGKKMESKQKKLPLLPGTNHFQTYYTRIFQRNNILHFYCFLLGGFAAKRLENLLTILFLFIHQMMVGLLIEIRNFSSRNSKESRTDTTTSVKWLFVCCWWVYGLYYTITLFFTPSPLLLSFKLLTGPPCLIN